MLRLTRTKLETYVTCMSLGFILFCVLLNSLLHEIGHPELFFWVAGPIGLIIVGGSLIAAVLREVLEFWRRRPSDSQTPVAGVEDQSAAPTGIAAERSERGK